MVNPVGDRLRSRRISLQRISSWPFRRDRAADPHSELRWAVSEPFEKPQGKLREFARR